MWALIRMATSELSHEKTFFLHMRNQRHRSAARYRPAHQRLKLYLLHRASTIPLLIKPLTIFFVCTAQFVFNLVINLNDRFSHDECLMNHISFFVYTCIYLSSSNYGKKRHLISWKSAIYRQIWVKINEEGLSSEIGESCHNECVIER